MKQLRPTDLKRLHREWNRRSPGRVALLLEGVQSPYNVGSIVRTAAAYRVEHLYLAGPTASPAAAKAAKVALGTERYLSWSVFEGGPDATDAAREEGYHVIGLELADQAVPLHQVTAGPDVCLVLGNEDHGLTPATLGACDAVAFVPLLGRVGSLNVATAAAIALYELRRKGWTG
ncbi:MAG TPA: TrmH family RNA methyltransferase [Acidimicrobiales bacterium]|nr:TrmH family RNA methyltransferase [Acidimicrobiales bacterium]